MKLWMKWSNLMNVHNWPMCTNHTSWIPTCNMLQSAISNTKRLVFVYTNARMVIVCHGQSVTQSIGCKIYIMPWCARLHRSATAFCHDRLHTCASKWRPNRATDEHTWPAWKETSMETETSTWAVIQTARMRTQHGWTTEAITLASSNSSLFWAGAVPSCSALMATGIFTFSPSGIHTPYTHTVYSMSCYLHK